VAHDFPSVTLFHHVRKIGGREHKCLVLPLPLD
jgi:hypothetical protein